MNRLSDQFDVRIEGHLKIFAHTCIEDVGHEDRGRCLLNKRNAIHPEHARIIIALGLADQPDGRIYRMWFGTGGATVDPTGKIIYATPNTEGAADLNNPVFFKVVDQNRGALPGNQMSVQHINGTLFTDLNIRAVIDKNEPRGQPAFDNTGPINLNRSSFIFREIGLKNDQGLLITHVTFNPITKASNIILEVSYQLRISIVV